MKKAIILFLLVFGIFVLAFSDKLKDKEKILEAREYAASPIEDDMMRFSVNGHTFDIDVYEYPNRKGEYPAQGMKYPDAVKACEAEGKRLCTDTEWSEACRGADMWLYSFGPEKSNFQNDREICNNIHGTRNAVPSATFDRCVSPDGLYDMSGNVWEWVQVKDTGTWLAKGGSYRDGELSHRCEFTFKLFESQVENLSFDNFGARCCRDVE